ncbi:uncharacterized protein LOC113870183 [Abrus precatorius]|uniref:Uncharacterized protein LOC113870183 n=1 Tax=Abrus precatorius TaxID=3816 RepID=A0A8B8M4D2_ABRPR|nr:uncharacterized protein LOC113870183 [Abrus precatorius]
MDALVKFPTIASCNWQGMNPNITKKLTIRFSPSKRKCNLHTHTHKMETQRLSMKKNVLKKYWDRHRISAITSKGDHNSLSPTEIVDEFYTCINEKELRHLREYISEDACFDDYTFTAPFQGKTEVMRFLEQLTDGMGRNVKFRVRRVYEGDDLHAAANWHLEWKEKQIPFTRGCSFFKLSKEGENIIILRAEVIIESPIKPGSIVLTLLKNLTSLFDDFPKATEWFLRSPHVILTWILKIHNIFVAPLINPLLDGYIKLWSVFVRLLTYAINIVIFISKIFFK